MFPLPIITYVKIGIVSILLLVSGWVGYSIETSRFDHYKAEQAAQVQHLQQEHQAAADQIRKEKDAQIASINSQLADALFGLHNRASRTDSTSIGQSRTGLSLFAEDAAFLERESARADVLREALSACYKQYDSLSK